MHALLNHDPAAFVGHETPGGFASAIKVSRFTTDCHVLADAGNSIVRLFVCGLLELKNQLEPITWEPESTKALGPEDVGRFLK
jgi:uncharacterized protein YecE (DUF72 family)